VFTYRNLSVAAAIVAFGTPLAASAQQTAYTASPVAIGACSVSSTTETIAGQPYFTLTIPQRNLSFSFVNNGKVPATKVTLVVDDGASPRQIEDRGTFSPRVRIDRRLYDATAANDGPATCTVAEVQFSDGSSWHAENVNLAKAQR
jgi:hypothetical protein